MKRIILSFYYVFCVAVWVVYATAQPFALSFTQPSLDRWMYPFNATPGTRPAAPVFGTLGDEAGVDSRHGQFILGFDIAEQITTNLGPSRYLIRRARLTATISRDRSFRYDPTPDTFTSYFQTNDVDFVADSDAGRPIELFGVGFRNGYTAETFTEDAPFGGLAAGGRNAFTAGYSTNGLLVDVGNNVGKTNALNPAFEVYPFAIGQTENISRGELVPVGTTIHFDLNLADPFVLHYLQQGCHSGRLRFAITGLHVSEFGGSPAWPEFYTRDSVLGNPPILGIEGTVISDVDSDSDGLPDDWEKFYFGSLAHKADTDPDGDGVSNLAELLSGTAPLNGSSSLALSSFRSAISGSFVIVFQHAAGRRYAIDYSTDCRSWTRIENPALIYQIQTGLAEWSDDGSQTGGLLAQRFYRVVVKGETP